MSMGMSYEEYWDGDNELPKYYRDKYKTDLQRENFNSWLLGKYIYSALCSVAPAYNPIETREPLPYEEKPFPLNKEEAEQRRIEKEKSDMEQAKERMFNMMQEFNKKFDGKGATE